MNNKLIRVAALSLFVATMFTGASFFVKQNAEKTLCSPSGNYTETGEWYYARTKRHGLPFAFYLEPVPSHCQISAGPARTEAKWSIGAIVLDIFIWSAVVGVTCTAIDFVRRKK